MSERQGLVALGIPEDCISRRSSAEENRRRFTIRPRSGDEIWCIKVDGCWLDDQNMKKVDYLFWGQSASGRRLILLVELKGKDFGRALQQIESTLRYFCKHSGDNIIHTGNHVMTPRHESPANGGVKAYVILSNGRGVPQRLRERGRLQERYGVIVHTRERKFEADGLDILFGR